MTGFGVTPVIFVKENTSNGDKYFLTTTDADVNRATTNNDHTVLSLACAGGHLSVVELLLNHNADPSHKLKVGILILS